jgi:hypothetical protein
MPTQLLLEQFGAQLAAAFGEVAYQVGSSLSTTAFRDVDVRVMLDDAQYEAMGLGDPDRPHENARWVAYALAFSALGRQMTGLPVDFQLQQTSHANAHDDGPRSALVLHWRQGFAERRAVRVDARGPGAGGAGDA